MEVSACATVRLFSRKVLQPLVKRGRHDLEGYGGAAEFQSPCTL